MHNKQEIRKRIYGAVAIGMTAVLFVLPGCSAKQTNVPELKEPKTMNESFRPVGYADIGDIEYRRGMVVPTSYCHFWEKSTAITEIHVELGQYVEEGDLLATADVKQIQETISNLEQEKENFIKNHEIDVKIYEQQAAEIEYRKKGCEMLNDIKAANQAGTDLSILNENHRYDELLYEYKLKKYNKDLAEYYELVNDAKIYARHSGYVSFCKDLMMTNQAAAIENVVIVSDYDDCYISMVDETIEKNLLKKYDVIYSYRNGVKYELEEIPYLSYEILAAEGRDIFPNIRLKFKQEGILPQAGNDVPVFLARNIQENVLCVGTDSLYEDSKGYYVYVKTQTGKEIRYIEIGKKDDKNVQILSGLQEGEKIFYSSEGAAPSEYELVTVESSTFEDIQKTDRIIKLTTRPTVLFSDYEGELIDIIKSNGDTVEADEVICKIKINDGTAALADMRNTMSSTTVTHESLLESYDDMIEELMKQQKQPIEKTIEVPDENGNLIQKKQYITRPLIRGELSSQIAIQMLRKEQAILNYDYRMNQLQNQYEKMSENNDGNGVISICAKEPGTVKELNYLVGDKIKVGDAICRVEKAVSPYVGVVTDNPMYLNQKLSFIDDEIEEIYTGKVIGIGGNALLKQVYVTTTDNGVYVNSGGSESGRNGFWAYVKADQDEYFTHYSLKGDKYAKYAAGTVADSYSLPAGVLFSETVLMTGEQLYYVWKNVDGELVKCYVDYLSSAVDSEGFRYDCVVNGIKEGDELAKSKEASSQGFSFGK